MTASRSVLTRSKTKLALMRHNLTNGNGLSTVLCCVRMLEIASVLLCYRPPCSRQDAVSCVRLSPSPGASMFRTLAAIQLASREVSRYIVGILLNSSKYRSLDYRSDNSPGPFKNSLFWEV